MILGVGYLIRKNCNNNDSVANQNRSTVVNNPFDSLEQGIEMTGSSIPVVHGVMIDEPVNAAANSELSAVGKH